MKRSTLMCSLGLAMAVSACGDNAAGPAPLTYTDPTGGALRLIKDPASNQTKMVLDLVVGDQPLTGYSVGFNLPFDSSRVKMAAFTAGTALSAGSEPVAAIAKTPQVGPLKGMLVTAQTQKASGTGAVTTDTTLPPGSVLYSVELDLVDGAPAGVVFDGTAAGFALPSGGMRNKVGTAVVLPKDVAIGKLEVFYP